MNIERCSVCFADIAGFNIVTRNMNVEQVVSFLQGVYELAGKVMLSHNGRLVKYMGDGVLCKFDRGREEIAVRAMWALRESFREYAAAYELEEVRTADLCAGIATGDVYAGQIGHPQMLAYDIIGRPLIVAQAMLRCPNITIDATTYEAVKANVIAEASEQRGEMRGYTVTGLR